MDLQSRQYNTLISRGALLALAGYLLSGPLAYFIVHITRPQPPWLSSAVFVDNYHVVQDIPYYFGFLLIGGMLMIATGHYLSSLVNPDTRQRSQLLIALALTIVFCGLISFNYVCQTTFVRNLALHYKTEHDAAIAAFSMTNPLSFCWANEMWGYAFLGISTWLGAIYYRRQNNVIRALMISNGIMSIGSAVWTIVDVKWVMTAAGLAGYFCWNVLMIIMMLMIYRQTAKARAAKVDLVR